MPIFSLFLFYGFLCVMVYWFLLTLSALSLKNCILLQRQVILALLLYSNLLIEMVTIVDFGAFLRCRLKSTMALKELSLVGFSINN